jgi:tungstate transport system substrate-binding protein
MFSLTSMKPSRRALLALALAGAAGLAAAQGGTPAGRSIVLASTTSTEQSGLFAHLLPAFTADTGIAVRVLALGTGQALDTARRGDADVVLVHDRAAEDRFVAEGWGLARRDVMDNDFVVVGPKSDPAKARGADVATALKAIAAHPSAAFVSRGDKSGTHAAELRYWAAAGMASPEKALGERYRACGCGMGPALNIAAGSADAYLLADRGTWLAFKNRERMAVLVEKDRRLLNPYGVIVVNPAKHPHVKLAEAQAFADWITGPKGQAAISNHKINGEPLFFPDAGK